MPKTVRKMRKNIEHFASGVGNLVMESFHYLALFIIALCVMWSAGVTCVGMLQKGHMTIDEILLLFIYLELAAMVGIYFRTKHMPVRFLIYVAMTALTRLLISDVQSHQADIKIIYIASGTLLFAISTLVIRFASYKYPSYSGDKDNNETEESDALQNH